MISVILPTVRPDLLLKNLNSISLAGFGSKWELIVVADYSPPLNKITNNIKWIIAPRQGVVAANNIGYANCNGDYVTTLSDEADLSFMALKKMEYFVKTCGDNVLCSPKHDPYFNFEYYGKYFAPFPFAHRSLIEKCGGLFLPEYKCFYADPDLSLRAYENGFDVAECQQAKIYHKNNMACTIHQDNVSKYVDMDRETFKKKWAHLGEFKDP